MIPTIPQGTSFPITVQFGDPASYGAPTDPTGSVTWNLYSPGSSTSLANGLLAKVGAGDGYYASAVATGSLTPGAVYDVVIEATVAGRPGRKVVTFKIDDDVRSANSSAQAVSTELTDHDDKLDGAISSIATIDSLIDALTTAVATIDGIVDGIASDLAIVDGVADGIATAVADVDSDVAAVPAAVRVELATELARIDEAVSAAKNIGQIAGSTTAANILADVMGGGTPSGTVSASPTPTTTTFTGSVTGPASAFVNAYVLFTSGTLAGQAQKITAFSSGAITVSSAFTEAPGTGDEYVVIGKA